MNVGITEVHLRLVDQGNVRAYASVLLGGEWVLRNLRIIRRADGTHFVSMPNEEVTVRCPTCHVTNRATANFCNQCGIELPACVDRQFRDQAFPVNARVRVNFEAIVLAEYTKVSAVPVLVSVPPINLRG